MRNSGKKAENISKKKLIILCAIGVFFITFLCITFIPKITTVTVSGTSYYSEDQIEDYFFGDGQSRSPVVFFFRNIFGEDADIPFVEDYSAKLTGLTSINVKLEVKSMVGYVEFMNSNLYFNRDGLVVESTEGLYPNIPKVTGLKLDSVVLGEKLPVESESTLTELLEITQFLTKTKLTWGGEEKTLINVVDRIHFDTNGEINLYVGGVKISIGTGYNLEQKLQEMADIIPSIEGKYGTLHLEGYSSTSGNHVYRFEEDKVAESKAAEESAKAESESGDGSETSESGAEGETSAEGSADETASETTNETINETKTASSTEAGEDVASESAASETKNSGVSGAGIGNFSYY